MSDATITFLENDIKKFEDAARFAHTEGVKNECLYLAEKLGLSADETRALTVAALCHDITKNLSVGEHRALCERHGIKYSPSPVLHQDTAAPFIAEKYGNIPEICDERVLSAVSKHTTGGDGMTLIDTALFVADFTEAGRKYENCAKMREYLHAECDKIKENGASAQKALYQTAEKICELTVEHLRAKGADIDPRTYKTLDIMRRRSKE